MLGLKKKKVEAKKEPEVKEKKIEIKDEPEINIEDAIEDIEIGVQEEVLKKYDEVAKEVEFCPASLTREKLMYFLKKKGLKIYNCNKVKKFLDKIYGERLNSRNEGDTGWYWVALIKEQPILETNVSRWTSGHIAQDVTYQKEIPLRTLQLIKEIKEEIPEVSFFVSDVAVPRPDPFLYVSRANMSGIVIDHWDEPTFKD